MAKVQEVIDKVTEGKFYSIWEAEDLVLELGVQKVADNLDMDDRRWYQFSTNVYKCEDGFVGVRGVSVLKSEMMSYEDCYKVSEAFECKEVQTVTYKRI